MLLGHHNVYVGDHYRLNSPPFSHVHFHNIIPSVFLLNAQDDDAETLQGSLTDVSDGDSFVAPSRNAQFKKFGREGTRQA